MRSVNRILISSLSLFLLAPAAPAPAAELPAVEVDFRIVMQLSYRDQPITIARRGDLVRQDFGDPALPAVIMNIQTGDSVILDGEERTASRVRLPVGESPLDPLAGARMFADGGLELEHIGDASVLGVECRVHRASALHAGEPFTFEICLSSAHNIALRTLVRGLQDGDVESVAVEFEVGPPDAGLFEIPPGYTEVDD